MLGGGGVPINLFEDPLLVGGGRFFFIGGGCIDIWEGALLGSSMTSLFSNMDDYWGIESTGSMTVFFIEEIVSGWFKKGAGDLIYSFFSAVYYEPEITCSPFAGYYWLFYSSTTNLTTDLGGAGGLGGCLLFFFAPGGAGGILFII